MMFSTCALTVMIAIETHTVKAVFIVKDYCGARCRLTATEAFRLI